MANGINVVDAIGSLYSGDYSSAREIPDAGTNANKIIWKDGHTTTSAEQDAIEAELIRLQAEYDAQDYARNRESEYPTIVDQLDDIFHNGIDGWKATIQVTKDKYPK